MSQPDDGFDRSTRDGNVAYWQHQAAKLEGATIVKSFYEKEEAGEWNREQHWITLHVRLKGDDHLTEVAVSSDDEGNGPGSLFIGSDAIGGGCLPRL